MSGSRSRKQKERLPLHPSRIVQTEVLPYEVPPDFSNHRFSSFLRSFDVRRENGYITWRAANEHVETVIRVLFLIEAGLNAEDFENRRRFKLTGNADKYSIPLELETLRPNGDTRILSVPHPSAQLRVMEYYCRFDSAILAATDKSPFSLRRPAFVARFTNVTDRLHNSLVMKWEEGRVEHAAHEYKTMHSYFSYRNFSNVYKFHESVEFQALERRYRLRAQVDVKQCFRSIYTHSITWATHGKTLVKDNLRRKSAKPYADIGESFSEAFDVVMQKSNYNETNGILIGPEYSRIFAEVILQRVDQDVMQSLESTGYVHGEDYDIRRYVDDYFVFAHNPDHVDLIVSILRKCLARFNLHLNDSKSEHSHHPSISPISAAKSQIRRRLADAFSPVKTRGSTRAGSRFPGLDDVAELITQYKIVLTSTGAPSAALANYSLTACERTLIAVLNRYLSGPKNSGSQARLSRRIASLMQFAWFIYSTSPMLSATVKMLRIVDHVAVFLERERLSSSIRGEILDCLSVELKRHLVQPARSARVNIETIYLLRGASRIGRVGLLEPDELAKIFGISRDRTGKFVASVDLDYFSLMSLLSYCGKRRRYALLKNFAESAALKRFGEALPLSAERVFLAVDYLACPYVSEPSKRLMFAKIGGLSAGSQPSLFTGKYVGFHDWGRMTLGRALDMKRSLEVY